LFEVRALDQRDGVPLPERRELETVRDRYALESFVAWAAFAIRSAG
jgi:hypothetical protein